MLHCQRHKRTAQPSRLDHKLLQLHLLWCIRAVFFSPLFTVSIHGFNFLRFRPRRHYQKKGEQGKKDARLRMRVFVCEPARTH